MLTARSIPAADLTPDLIEVWSRCQRACPELDSPFFRPEYTRAVAAHAAGVRVAVLAEAGEPVGFLPYQEHEPGLAGPVGGTLCDFQGLIAPAGLDLSAERVLAECGLRSYRFDHLLASQPALAAHAWRRTDSPRVELSHGFDRFARERSDAGSRLVSDTLRKMRKAERELGPLRLVAASDDRDVFDATLGWKREQYRRIGSIDHLADPGKTDVLERIWKTRGEHFRGMLSALYIGGRLAATHLGMFSGGVLHCWFPAYPHDDPQLARYSPGIALWLMLMQQAEPLGMRRLDLGKGDEPYKRRMANGSTPIAEGAVDLRPVAGTLQHGWQGFRELVRRSPLKRPVQGVLRQLRTWKRG